MKVNNNRLGILGLGRQCFRLDIRGDFGGEFWTIYWAIWGAFFFPFLYKQSRNISANWIIFLFSFANTLEALYLNNNRLGILADNAFAQMTNLKELNLADNQLAALPPTLFTTQMNSLESLQVSAGTSVVKSFYFWHCDLHKCHKHTYSIDNLNSQIKSQFQSI